MKIITNEKAIKRNRQFSFWAAIASPVLFAFSLTTLFNSPNQIGGALVFFVFGFIFYQVAIIFRKWGQGFEEDFTKALKKLSADYSLYNFHAPVSHLLVGPAGIWILVPRSVRGTIGFSQRRNKWKLERPEIKDKLMAPFRESLGRPDMELVGEADALDRHLQTHWEEDEPPHISAAIVFTDPETVIKANEAPIPTLHIADLRTFIRSQEKENKMSAGTINKFKRLFETEEDD